MGLRPVGNKIIIKFDEDQWNIPKPILIKIPDAYKGRYARRPMTGRIVSLGTRCRKLFKVGQRILFSRVGHLPEAYNGYRFILDTDVLGLIDD